MSGMSEMVGKGADFCRLLYFQEVSSTFRSPFYMRPPFFNFLSCPQNAFRDLSKTQQINESSGGMSSNRDLLCTSPSCRSRRATNHTAKCPFRRRCHATFGKLRAYDIEFFRGDIAWCLGDLIAAPGPNGRSARFRAL